MPSLINHVPPALDSFCPSPGFPLDVLLLWVLHTLFFQEASPTSYLLGDSLCQFHAHTPDYTHTRTHNHLSFPLGAELEHVCVSSPSSPVPLWGVRVLAALTTTMR